MLNARAEMLQVVFHLQAGAYGAAGYLAAEYGMATVRNRTRFACVFTGVRSTPPTAPVYRVL